MNYILHGKEETRVLQKLQALKNKYQTSQSTYYFDAQSVSQDIVLDEIDSVSMFDDCKMVVIKNASFLSSKDKTKYDIESFIARSNKQEDVIIVFLVMADKLDTRKKLVKQLASISTVYPCISLDDKSVGSYVREQMEHIGLKMDGPTFNYVCKRIGYDSMRISQELNKLRTYNSFVSMEDVQALLVNEPMHNVFKMVDALFDKNGLLLISYYRNFRALKMEPVAINGLLSGQVRFLFQVRELMDEGYYKDDIASILKAHPYRVQLSMQRANRFTSDELLEQLSILANLDQSIKMGLIDKDEGFEQFFLKMCA